MRTGKRSRSVRSLSISRTAEEDIKNTKGKIEKFPGEFAKDKFPGEGIMDWDGLISYLQEISKPRATGPSFRLTRRS